MPPTLYAYKHSRSNRVLWLCAELEIECNIHELEPTDSGFKSPDFLQVNPLGLVPVLVDGGAPISESGAILMYLTATYGGGRLSVVPGHPEFGQYLRWMWAAEASVMPAIDKYYDNYLASAERDERVLVKLRDEARSRFGVAESVLKGGQDFIVGQDFTAADIMLGYAVFELFGCELLSRGDLPHLAAYLDRLTARPACRLGTPLSLADIEAMLHGE